MAVIFEKLGIQPRVLKALLGAMLLKFSTSITTCWGNINLYFLSEFHYQGARITQLTNSTILLISVIPMILSLISATKLCNKFGHETVIRACSLIFLLSPLTIIISFNLYSFVIFSIILPGSAFAMSSIPILNCMWTQFPESKNKATAILVIAFGIGSIVWNLLFMHMINPGNQAAIGHGNISYFSQNVTSKVKNTAIIGFVVTGCLALIGSCLIQRKKDHMQNEKAKQTEPIEVMDRNMGSNEILNIQQFKVNKFEEALKDQRFILIMLISFLTGLYQIHLMMNFKIIFMPLVNDDHFLGYSSMICSIVAILGAFLWGYLGDLKGVAFTILLLSILDFGSKIYSDFAVTKTMIILMVVLIGLISKSMTTLAGPGFVEYFGIQVGTELLPFKGIAILIGYLIVPFFQLISSSFLSPRDYLVCISFASIITLFSSVRLYYIHHKSKKLQSVIPRSLPNADILSDR